MSIVVGIDASRSRSGGARSHLIGVLWEGDPSEHGVREVHVWSYRALLDSLPNARWLVKHNPPELERSLFQHVRPARDGVQREESKTVIGEKCHIMAYAHIAHNCIVGNGVIIANCGTLAGHVEMGDHAILGGLSAVHQFVRIGTLVIIGGCSKVTQDIPPFMMADGHPAEVRAINKVGLERKGASNEVQRQLRTAYKILFREGLTIPNALARIQSQAPPLPEIEHLIQFVRASERGICK